MGMTQHTAILKLLKQGWTTPLQALYCAGTMKLATRVSEFRRDGHIIIDRWVEQDGKRFKAYRMVMTKTKVYRRIK
jgi:hypothetical protein